LIDPGSEEREDELVDQLPHSQPHSNPGSTSTVRAGEGQPPFAPGS